jgi:type I restriction enzyme S subunit
MSSNGWKRVKLENSVVEIIDGDRGTNYPKQDEFFERDYCLFLNAGNVTVDGFNFEKTQFISKEKDALLRKGKLKRNDIVLTTRGTVGNVAYYDNSIPFDDVRINSGMVILRVDLGQQQIYTQYLYHFLKSPLFRESILSHSSGSAQPQLPIRDLKQIELLLPPFDTQRRIAYILSALEEKIELNRASNATLETIAQSIFKEWFVEFHFPNATGEMVESELGMIPKGWRVVTFEDELEADRGLSYKGAGLESGNAMPMHNLNSVYEGGGYKFDGIKYYSGEHKEKHIVRPGDLIVTNTEQGHKYLLIGYPAIVPSTFGDIGIYSHHIYRVRPKPLSYLTADFVYQLLLQPATREQVIGFANGTTVNMLKIEGLQKPRFVLPPKELVSKFSELASSIRLRHEENINQSTTLAAVRDTLLPKLMNGEIEV